MAWLIMGLQQMNQEGTLAYNVFIILSKNCKAVVHPHVPRQPEGMFSCSLTLTGGPSCPCVYATMRDRQPKKVSMKARPKVGSRRNVRVPPVNVMIPKLVTEGLEVEVVIEAGVAAAPELPVLVCPVTFGKLVDGC